MKIAVHNVVINLGDQKNTKPSKQVWDWELPILEEKFPGGLVAVTGTDFVDREELPEAGEEFSRLVAMYGSEEDTGQSFVHLAYDRGEKGVKALRKAIEASASKTEKAAETKAAKTEKAAEAKAEKDNKAAKAENKPADPLD